MAQVVDDRGTVLYRPQTNRLWIQNPTRGGTSALNLITRSGTGRVRLPQTNGGQSPNTTTLMRPGRTPVAPRTRTTTSSAPRARTAPRPTGPSPAEVARREAAAAARAAELRAQRAANNAARSSANSDIDRFNAQIAALTAKRNTNAASLEALKRLVGKGKGSHASVRDAQLAALDQALKTKLGQIRTTFEESIGDFRTNLRDNEASEADASFDNLSNRARETQDVVSQALSQGAGESDVLRSQLQALRNWSSNQSDINRSFFDTRASVNAGITDLNMATQTGMKNEEMSTNAARGQRWDDFYDATGQTFSDMANLDQQNYLLDSEIAANRRQRSGSQALVSWLDSGKNAEDYKASTAKSESSWAPKAYTSDYARKAAEAAGSVWKDPGISKATQEWEGAAQSEGSLNNSQLWNAQANTAVDGTRRRKRPEGATLRRW